MKRESKHFTIKNVILLSAKCAKTPVPRTESLYELWCCAKKDILREVLEDAFLPVERENQDVFYFCEVEPANIRVQRILRLHEYENPADYVTFKIKSWGAPIKCEAVDDLTELVFQEFTVTCDIKYTNQIAVRDENGKCKYGSNGKVLKRSGGVLSAEQTFIITDLDEDLAYDE